MGSRSEALASRFDEAVEEFSKVVESCSDAQWQRTCGAEGWTVGATAQHVAGQFPLEREFIEEAANGRRRPELHVGRHQRQERYARGSEHERSKAEVLALLREGAAPMTAYMRGLSDEQLDRTAPLKLAGGAQSARSSSSKAAC